MSILHHKKKMIARYSAFFLAAAAMMAGLAYTYHIGLMPLKYIAVMAFAAVILLAILWFLLIKAQHILLLVLGGIITVLLLAGTAVYIYTINRGLTTLDSFTGNTEKNITFSLVARKDSPVQLSDIPERRVGVVSRLDAGYLSRITSEQKVGAKVEADSYLAVVAKLYEKDVDAIIVNTATLALVDTKYPKFKDETRVLKTFSYTEQNKAADTTKIDESGSFNIYISGIDTYGSVATVSRSDVNMVATINNRTKKILLTTIPRDAYVAIPGGGAGQKDKLTHAGIYGVDASIGAVEGVLDTKMAGYIRINFTSLISLVDAIGGVTVQNPIAFNSFGGSYFPAGPVNLNGARALEFSRERKSLAGSDNDRGKNQMRVLTAIIKKLSRPDSAGSYDNALKVLSRSMQTNIEQSTIKKLVNNQIDSGSPWNVEAQSLEGVGSTGRYRSYAMPDAELYMYVLGESSIEGARQKVRQFLNE